MVKQAVKKYFEKKNLFHWERTHCQLTVEKPNRPLMDIDNLW